MRTHAFLLNLKRKIVTQCSEPLTATLRPDLIAGLAAAAVVLPKAMAYATVAGLSVSVGLYTAFVPMIVYAVLGTSRVLSVSSTTTLAILTGVELAAVVPDNDPVKVTAAAATLTALTGILLIGASVSRLGFLANFISTPVLTGFKAGIGMVIVLDQIPKLLGIHIDKQGFFRDVVNVAQHVSETSLITLGVGAATVVALFVIERLKPHSAAPLLVVGAGIAASRLFDLSASGVATVGVIPQSLPSITPPGFDFAAQLLPSAFGIALMSFTETIAAGRAFARSTDSAIRPNRELLATGMANLLGAFFGAMPAGGGTSQTAVVRSVGGRTQKASMVTAAAAAATMLVLAPFLGFLPQAVLAAVVIVYSVGLINPAEFSAISKIRTMELTWAIAAFFGVLVFGTLQGIVVAIALSLVGLSSQAVNSKVYVIGRKRGADVLRPLTPEHPDDETIDGLLILRPEGRLFFANAQPVGDQIRALVSKHRPKVVVLDMSRVPDIEYSALQMLTEGERHMTKEGVRVWLAALNPSVLTSIRASPLEQRLGRDRLLFNAREAIRKYQEELATRDTYSPPGA
jgi:SulP family sulfate permease